MHGIRIQYFTHMEPPWFIDLVDFTCIVLSYSAIVPDVKFMLFCLQKADEGFWIDRRSEPACFNKIVIVLPMVNCFVKITVIWITQNSHL
jgi:hypothetical protein